MKRLRLNRNVGGRKPTWKYTATRGAMTQTSKAGGIDAIDAIRYQREVLHLKLIPFAIKCEPEFIVQEDKCPSHASHFQQELMYTTFYNFFGLGIH
jgi:hypothetical protein